MSGDLDGITVVSVEQAVAAPLATRQLADAGARVIKVERPEGDFARGYDRTVEGQSAYFVWLNRGKESVCLDLKVPSDRALLRSMITRADVFVQNLRPNLLARMRLGPDQMRVEHPRLITCEITGFGLSGPRSGLKAYDLIVQAESGLCAITGDHTGPARVGVSVCDIAAGMNAHAAILQALYARTRTGQGRAIGVSLFDSIADWMNVPLLQYLYGGKIAERAGVSHPTIAPYGVFACRDGVSLIVSIQNEREWMRFCRDVLGREDLLGDRRFIDNPARVVNRDQLDAIVAERFAQLTSAEVSRSLDEHKIAYGRLNSLEQAAEHPHLRWVSVSTPAAEIRVVAPAVVVGGNVQSFGPVPTLDQHGGALRAEFS